MSIAPQVSVYVNVSGNGIDFDDCSRQIGLVPTRTWRAKVPLPRLLATSSWSVGFEKKEYYAINDAVRVALDLVWSNRQQLTDYAARNGYTISVTCDVTVSEDRPVYELTVPQMARLVELGADFGLDVFDNS